ncbi:hypothetical protein M514_01814 [Trichuris suis]|uniref:BTB domain-containing protein n=1 Tax=Trichuris suis TaxID=68888 RepID=A0A085NT92_9BILA|nr:hypothetical protein M514_01814 [Trichuris suis]
MLYRFAAALLLWLQVSTVSALLETATGDHEARSNGNAKKAVPPVPQRDRFTLEPTPEVDLFDPFKEKTTQSPEPTPDQVVVNIQLGKIIGTKMVMPGLKWTPDRDPRDQIPIDQKTREPFPLSPSNDVTIFVFLGIPYARKPIGPLRFQKLFHFEGDTIYANKLRPSCPQDVDARPTLWFEEPYEHRIEEDCLYLNVYTPQVSRSVSTKYPVIVFFHGGGFQTGSSSDWPGHILATKGVVVVTANYRLGPLGFLSMGDHSTGNYGLMDQNLVLEWVQNYIYAFNGDFDRVTIVGHGAGAVSVGLHMLSPMSAGLFKAAAAMSGSDLSYHQVITNTMLAYNNTIKLGRHVGCTQTIVKDVWNCLLTRSPNDLVEGVEYNRYAFLPVVDGNFIPASPEILLQKGAVPSAVPYLTGINQNDGTEVLLSERDLARLHFLVDNKFVEYKIMDYVLKRNFTTNREAALDAIKYLYTFWPDVRDNDATRERFIHLASDAYYVSPVSKSAQMRSESGSIVYMYVNSYNFSTNPPNKERFLPIWMGACHECDLFLLFGFPWMPKELLPRHLRNVYWTDSDKNMSEVFMAMWKQFARSQNPNLPHENVWTNYGPRDHYYLKINTTRSLHKDYDWEHVAFWNVYLNQLSELYTTTFSPIEASIRKEHSPMESRTSESFYEIIDESETQVLLEKLINVTAQYSWLLNAFMVDFFVDELYSRIPRCWQQLYTTVRIEDVTFLLSSSTHASSTRVWPLSLLALRSFAFTHSLRRHPLVSADTLCPLAAGRSSVELSMNRLEHVSPKKIHQIRILGSLIGRFFERCNILVGGVAVDAGSGKGHLARLLREAYGLKVIAIDSNNEVVSRSRVIDLKRANKNLASDPPVVHLVQRLTKQGWLDSLSKSEPLALIGLHACGYLSEHLIREFIVSDRCKLLFSVGCCYMRLATQDQMWKPLSRRLQSIKATASFGYAALDCACHSNERLITKLADVNCRSSLIVHCYRAALEWVLVRRFNCSRRCRLYPVREAHLLNFADYAGKATRNLNLNLNYLELENDVTVTAGAPKSANLQINSKIVARILTSLNMWAKSGHDTSGLSLGSASSSVSMESTSSACSSLHDDVPGSNGMSFTADEGLVHITEKHGDEMVNWMNILRRSDQLCDVTLVVSNRQIRGHRILFATIGGIVSELLLSNQRGPISSTHDGMDENCYSAHWLSHAGTLPSFKMYTNERGLFLEFPTVDFECMEALVNFVYSGRLIVPKAKVSGLYDLACLLHCDSVARICAEYLCANLCIANCISTRKCANRFNDTLLASLVDQYIQDHFEAIIQESHEFSSLPHILVKIISDKGQTIDWKLFNEKYMGDKLLEWFQQRVRELPAHMEFRMDILSEKVKSSVIVTRWLALYSVQPLACYFDEEWNLHDCFEADDASSVGSCDLVQEFKRSTQKLYCSSNGEGNTANSNGWKNCQHAASNGGHYSNSSDWEEIEWKIVTLYKITDVTFTGIFLIKRQMAVITIELVSHENARPRTPSFLSTSQGNLAELGHVRLARMATPRCAGGVVVANDRLIVIGGYNRMECLTSVECYDSSKNQWNAVSSLLVKRSHLNASFCDGKVYAVGGMDGSSDLASVEQWDPSSYGSWKFVAPLPSGRSSMGVVTVGGCIYCIGGCDGRKILNECLKYNPSNDEWTTVASMNASRAEMACVAWKGRIFAIAGCDDWNKLYSVESYSVEEDEWFDFSPLLTARRGCGAAVLNDKLYVVGGTDGVQSLDSVECVDLNSKDPVWRPVPAMNSRRANVRLVVFEDRLYAVGGFDGSMFLNSVEYFENGAKEWKKFK